ncbi:MAG: epoxyqueuosine reductase [Spirochaetota bacterium]
MPVETEIKGYARSLGASAVAVVEAGEYPGYARQVRERLADRGFDRSDYLLGAEEPPFYERLAFPRRFLPWARSIILIGVYALDKRGDFSTTGAGLRGKIARTYRYYPVVRSIAEQVSRFASGRLGVPAEQGQQVPLKLLASRTPLGSYGENGLLLSPAHGSYTALRAVVTGARLRPDPEDGRDYCLHCGACRRACPTGALYEPYKVDPSLCVNTVGRKSDPVPPELRAGMGGWFRGCDVCQEACPRNRELVPREPDRRAGFEPRYHTSHRFLHGMEPTPPLIPLLAADRPPLIRRNAAICLGNIAAGDPRAVHALRAAREEADGWLAGYLDWALERADGKGVQGA